MKNTTIFLSLILISAGLLFSCSAVPLLTGNDQSLVSLNFSTAGFSSSARELNSGTRYLAAENDRATLTIHLPDSPDETYQFNSTIDYSGRRIFSVQVKATIGVSYTFIVKTYDALGSLLTSGSSTNTIVSKSMNLTITMAPASVLTTTAPLDMANGASAYLECTNTYAIGSGVTTIYQISSTNPAVRMWLCNDDGTFTEVLYSTSSSSYNVYVYPNSKKILHILMLSGNGRLTLNMAMIA